MSPDWLVVLAPATGLVGVVVGAALNRRFAAMVSQDTWRRDSLLKIHIGIADCIADASFNEKDAFGVKDLAGRLYPLRTRAALLNSQCVPVLDEMLEDAWDAIKTYRKDPVEAFQTYAPQFHISQFMLLEVMQDELNQRRINPKKNETRVLAIKNKMMDGSS